MHPGGPLSKQLETRAFRSLNAVIEPLVRAGVGGPLLTPFGAVVLETVGRKSGARRRVPLLATVVGDVTIVATYRGRRSEWVKNLAAQQRAAWWLNGRRVEGTATVFAPGIESPSLESLPAWLQGAQTHWGVLVASGWAVAALVEDR